MATRHNKRLKKEYDDITKSGPSSFKNLEVNESNILCWTGLIAPEKPPYNAGAFRVEIVFPAEYPFRPPKVTFKTKIYHPNVDESGLVCLPIISPENWKPATRADQIIQALVALVHKPEPEHALRGDLGRQYMEEPQAFEKSAREHTIKNAEKRPT